jgi:ribosome-associated heat shock protein Hsp15
VASEGSQRIDKWLFFARVVKSRSLAQKLVATGGVRINSNKVDQPAATVKAGDGVTVRLERQVRVFKVLDPGKRRGPAEEARTLYEDLTPPPEPDVSLPHAAREPGAGRPTKRDRRTLDRWLDTDSD